MLFFKFTTKNSKNTLGMIFKNNLKTANAYIFTIFKFLFYQNRDHARPSYINPDQARSLKPSHLDQIS